MTKTSPSIFLSWASLALALPAAAGPIKVDVCHQPPGDPTQIHTIRVSENAVGAHVANHGDVVGMCDEVCDEICFDGDLCTQDCDGDNVVCYDPSPPVDCDDSDPGTVDTCSPGVGCINTPLTETACWDGVDDDLDGMIDCDDSDCCPDRDTTDADAVVYGAYSGESMWNVGAPGDIDGDGRDDLLTHRHGTDSMYLWTQPLLGATDARSAAATWTVSSPQGFVRQLSAMGDLSGDGVSDFALKTNRDVGQPFDYGAIYLLPGGTSYAGTRSLSSDAFATVVGQFDRAIRGFDGSSDFDGDGFNDLMVDAVADLAGSGNGYLYVLYGPLSGTVSAASAADVVFQDTAFTQGAAYVLSGDVNGDGTPDAVITLSTNADGNKGVLYTVLGPLSGTYQLPADADSVVSGDAAGDLFGRSEVPAIADLNGDGADDILVSSPYADVGGTDDGQAFVIYGSVTPASGPISTVADLTISGTGGETLGARTSIADLDGTGTPDLLIAAWSATTQPRGLIFKDPGAGTLSSADADVVISGDPAENFGLARVLGDLNGDGHPDVGMTGSADDPSRPTETDHGGTWVWYGPF